MSTINIKNLQTATTIDDNDFILMEKPEGTRKVLGSVFIKSVKGDKGDTPSIAHLETKINNLVVSTNEEERLRSVAELKRLNAEQSREAAEEKRAKAILEYRNILDAAVSTYQNVTTISNSEIDTIIANALK